MFLPCSGRIFGKKYLFWKEYVSVMDVVTVTNRRDFRINLTCSGISQTFEMPDLEFLSEFLPKPCSGIFAENGDRKGRHVPE